MTDTPRLVNGAYEYNGQRLPRVTTVLGILSKPGLEKWKHRVGLVEAERVSREAAGLGTEIHAACEYIARCHMAGDLPLMGPPPHLRSFVEAYHGWLAENVEAVESVEQFVYHPRDLYAGTADLTVRLRDGRRMLVDIKSSNSIDGSYRLQTSAYADALDALGEPVDGRMIVNLPSRRPGVLNVIEYDDDARDLKAWKAALRLWRWNQRHADDWKRLGR